MPSTVIASQDLAIGRRKSENKSKGLRGETSEPNERVRHHPTPGVRARSRRRDHDEVHHLLMHQLKIPNDLFSRCFRAPRTIAVRATRMSAALGNNAIA
jgi:hypothetical protein